MGKSSLFVDFKPSLAGFITDRGSSKTYDDFFALYLKMKTETDVVQVLGSSVDSPRLCEADRHGHIGKMKKQKNKLYTWIKNQCVRGTWKASKTSLYVEDPEEMEEPAHEIEEKEQEEIEEPAQEMEDQEVDSEQSITVQSKSRENSFLHDSRILQEKETLSEQKRCFLQEKVNFEQERKRFTEAAIRLGRDRQAFETEKANLLQKREGTTLQTSTPLKLPALSGKPKTPSTAELYKFLGLTPKDPTKREKTNPSDIKDHHKATTDTIFSESRRSASCNLRSETVSNVPSLVCPRRPLFSSGTKDDLNV